MLKSTFKKVSAIAIAGTMLAGMMAVPANAWTSTQVSKTETAISEDFSSFTEGTEQVMTDTPTSFAGNSNITVKKDLAYGDVNYPNGFKASIEENSLSLMGKQGAQAVLYNKSGSTSVQPGDVITVTFKYKYDANQGKMRVNLNDSPTSRSNFVYITSSGGLNDAVDHASDAGKARILCISMGNQRIHETDAIDGIISGRDYWRGPNITTNAWNEITITIDTANDEYDGKQTIKVQKDSNFFIGYYDADYTGDGDANYDPIEDISSITFATNGALWGVSGRPAENNTPNEGTPNCWIDDISVQVTGDRPEYQSELSNVVVNETFDNLVETTLPTTATSITGTSLQGKNVWGGSWKIAPDTVGGNAVAKITAGGGSQMAADFTDVAIGRYGEVRVSYDREFYTSWRSGINVKTDGFGANDSNLGTRLVPVNDTSKVATGAIEAFVNGKLMIGVLDHGDCWPVAGETHHVEYVIKVSDPEYGNKQTLTYTISGGENSIKRYGDGNYSSSYKCVYYFDADSSDDEDYTKLTSLKNFGAYVEGTSAYNLDNLKVEVINPGFEVADDYTASGNTYSFSTNDPIALNYVVDASAASKVIVAQYGADKRMIDATTENVSATGTVTVIPNPNAKTIKVMVLDMSTAVPYAKVFVMTRQ